MGERWRDEDRRREEERRRYEEEYRAGSSYGRGGPYAGGSGRDYGEVSWRGYGRDEDERERWGREGDYRSGGSALGGRYGEGYGGYGQRSGYGSRERSGYGYGGREQGQERGMWDRAADEVSSWFGDEDAERRRRMDAAREGKHRGRGPKGYARSDDRIREDVSDRLSDDSMVDASEIEVTVSNREVTLSGTVESREARRRAEDCAENVSGVSYVQNNLRVKQEGMSSSAGASGMGMTGTSESGTSTTR